MTEVSAIFWADWLMQHLAVTPKNIVTMPAGTASTTTTNTTTAVIPAANGSVKFKDVPALKKKDVIGATASVVPGKKNVTARTIASSRKNSVVMKKIAARMTVAMPKNAVKMTAATPENVVAVNGIAETTIVAVTTANPLLYG